MGRYHYYSSVEHCHAPLIFVVGVYSIKQEEKKENVVV